MIDTASLSPLLSAAGVTFTGIGGNVTTAQRTLSWSGVPVRIDGLPDDQVTAAQAVLDANPLSPVQIAEYRLDLSLSTFEIASRLVSSAYPPPVPTQMLTWLTDSANQSRPNFLTAEIGRAHV